MTWQEQRTVLKLLSGGAGYKKIATQLGLPVNTVKSFCRRQNGGTEQVCANCGAALVQTPHHKAKRFCSDRCRMAWWNAHQDQVNRKAVYVLTCKYCGKEFESYGNRKRVYCSRGCYDAARRKKREE